MDEIRSIVDEREFEKLIGMTEGPFLEAKSTPYDVTQATQRFELAKDVTAFANAAGGFIFIGVVTVRAADSAVDTVQSLTPIAEPAFAAERLAGVLREYVYPDIHGLEIVWRPTGPAAGGIGVIHVPPQDPDRGPFLIARVLEADESIRAIAMGYVERVSSANEPMPHHKLHTAFRQGRDSVSRRLTRIEQKLDALVDTAAQAPAEPDRSEELLVYRIDSAFRAQL